jgi:hypothetical protein
MGGVAMHSAGCIGVVPATLWARKKNSLAPGLEETGHAGRSLAPSLHRCHHRGSEHDWQDTKLRYQTMLNMY